MTTLEQTMETIRAWPLADRQRLQLFLQQGLQEQKPSSAQPELADTTREAKLRRELDEYRSAKQWIAEHRAQYLGQWVALAGDRLISHGANAKQVYNDAKAAGIQIPFVVQIIEEPTHYVGGFEICR